MKPTDEDIRVIAYFEAEERKRKGEAIPEALAKLAAEAPPRDLINSRVLFYGWVATVGPKQHVLTLKGQEVLQGILRGCQPEPAPPSL